MDNKFKIQEIYLKHKIISNDVLDGEEFIDLISDLRKINFNQKLSNFAESKRISLQINLFFIFIISNNSFPFN